MAGVSSDGVLITKKAILAWSSGAGQLSALPGLIMAIIQRTKYNGVRIQKELMDYYYDCICSHIFVRAIRAAPMLLMRMLLTLHRTVAGFRAGQNDVRYYPV